MDFHWHGEVECDAFQRSIAPEDSRRQEQAVVCRVCQSGVGGWGGLAREFPGPQGSRSVATRRFIIVFFQVKLYENAGKYINTFEYE